MFIRVFKWCGTLFHKIKSKSQGYIESDTVAELWLFLNCVKRLSGLAPYSFASDGGKLNGKLNISYFGVVMTAAQAITLSMCYYYHFFKRNGVHNGISLVWKNQVSYVGDICMHYGYALVLTLLFSNALINNAKLMTIFKSLDSINRLFLKQKLYKEIKLCWNTKFFSVGLLIIFFVFYSFYLGIITSTVYRFNKRMPEFVFFLCVLFPNYYIFIMLIQYINIVNIVRQRYSYLQKLMKNLLNIYVT